MVVRDVKQDMSRESRDGFHLLCAFWKIFKYCNRYDWMEVEKVQYSTVLDTQLDFKNTFSDCWIRQAF